MVETFTSSIFQEAMQSALKKAADDLHSFCTGPQAMRNAGLPQENATVQMTLPEGVGEVYEDGKCIGKTGEAFPLSPGSHSLEVRLTDGRVLNMTLAASPSEEITINLK